MDALYLGSWEDAGLPRKVSDPGPSFTYITQYVMNLMVQNENGHHEDPNAWFACFSMQSNPTISHW